MRLLLPAGSTSLSCLQISASGADILTSRRCRLCRDVSAALYLNFWAPSFTHLRRAIDTAGRDPEVGWGLLFRLTRLFWWGRSTLREEQSECVGPQTSFVETWRFSRARSITLTTTRTACSIYKFPVSVRWEARHLNLVINRPLCVPFEIEETSSQEQERARLQ